MSSKTEQAYTLANIKIIRLYKERIIEYLVNIKLPDGYVISFRTDKRRIWKEIREDISL